MRLRWPKSSADRNEQRNNECPSPAHLVVPEKRNIDAIDSEIQRHTQYKQNDKTENFVTWQGSAEEEGCRHNDCASSDKSNKDR